MLAGPAVGAMFAELGATVIKLEPLGGDVTRSWKLAGEDPANDVPAYFSCVNWGKQSLAVNLKTAEGRQIARSLALQADVVIANYKPGAAERLGMDYASLSQAHPGLIYAHLTGYGGDDPRTGYDALIQAESGFLHLNGRPGEAPVKLPVALMDLLAAHQLKEAVLVALIEKLHSGRGTYLPVSLMASALASLANQASNWLVAGHAPQAMGLEHPNIVPYGTLYQTQDNRQVMLAIGSDAQFASLMAILDASSLAADPRFASNAARVRHRELLQAELRPRMAALPADDLLAKLWQAEIPAGEVKTIPQALAQPAAQELLLQADGLKGLRTSVFTTSGSPLTAPPRLGADTRTILQHRLQFSPESCEQLIHQGIVSALD